MTESQDSLDTQVSASAAAFGAADTTLGRCLSEARKSRGLSIDDVAQAIKFSPRQIEAIESDDFGKLPGTPIVRGFVRSYAKLLRLDSLALLTMFDKQVPPVAVTMQVLTDTGAALPQAGERHALAGRALGLVAVCAAITAAAWAYYYWSPVPATPAPASATAPAFASVPTASEPTPSAEHTAASETAAVLANSANAAVGAAGATEIGAVPGGDRLIDATAQVAPLGDPDSRQLIFVFTEKAWVEVKDASKHTIFAQNNLPGTRQIVTGKPPFAVVIGNASHVQLLYEERQIDLQPYTKVDVARLNLE